MNFAQGFIVCAFLVAGYIWGELLQMGEIAGIVGNVGIPAIFLAGFALGKIRKLTYEQDS